MPARPPRLGGTLEQISLETVSRYSDFQEVPPFHVKWQTGRTAVVFLSFVLLPTAVSLCIELGTGVGGGSAVGVSSEIP